MYITGYTLNVKEKLKGSIIVIQEVGRAGGVTGVVSLPDVIPNIAKAFYKGIAGLTSGAVK